MKILITGGCGQLGRSLKDVATSYPQHDFIHTDIDTLDITDYRRVDSFIAQQRPDVMINCAAYTAVDTAENDPEQALRLNAEVVETLAQIARRENIFLVHISTDYVFNGKGFRPYNEDHATAPVSVYGKTKLLGEQAVLRHRCHSAIVRTSWLYSEYGTNFVKTMLRLGEEQQQINVVNDQIGTPTCALDLAEAIMQIVSRKDLVEQTQIYHFSNEGIASWYDFAKAIMELGNRPCEVLPVATEQYPTPAQRPFYSVLDKQKIKSRFSLTIPYWKKSLEACIERISKGQ
ncbi:MAG: dTDP-4-dehydrorhamnose reductase [Bacteroidales bacterium]|jgi:dTDP-4-dehydrorhamnose reductase|nr:dTDP-4-dehydrorhamnose reductase [Bacteroidales bacterium]